MTTSCYPRWLLILLAVELTLPSVLLMVAMPEPVTMAVPLAGPWAARLYGHSCGMDANMPVAAWCLLLFGIASLTLAARGKRPLAVLPAALLWWPAWLLTAFVSAINAHE